MGTFQRTSFYHDNEELRRKECSYSPRVRVYNYIYTAFELRYAFRDVSAWNRGQRTTMDEEALLSCEKLLCCARRASKAHGIQQWHSSVIFQPRFQQGLIVRSGDSGSRAIHAAPAKSDEVPRRTMAERYEIYRGISKTLSNFRLWAQRQKEKGKKKAKD